jgi:hypothetical protein
MQQFEYVLRLRDIARRYDIEGLRDEIDAALEGLPEKEKPFVPTRLVTALDRFHDSYVRQPVSDEG